MAPPPPKTISRNPSPADANRTTSNPATTTSVRDPKEPKRSPPHAQDHLAIPAKRPDNTTTDSAPSAGRSSEASRASSRSSVPSSAGDAETQIIHLQEIITQQQEQLDKAESAQGYDEAKGLLDTAIERLRRVDSERKIMKQEKAELAGLRDELQATQIEIREQLEE